MSKKKISLTKLKTVAEKGGEKKPKQITISKFFSAPKSPVVAQQESGDASVVVVGLVDDESLKKQDTAVRQV